MTKKGEDCLQPETPEPVAISFRPGPYYRIHAKRRLMSPRAYVRGMQWNARNNAGGYWNLFLHNLASEWELTYRLMPAWLVAKISMREIIIEEEIMTGTGRYAPGSRASRRTQRYFRKHPVS